MDLEKRIDNMDFTEKELEFIWYDWPNWDDHIEWLLNATRNQIQNWLDICLKDISQ